MISALNICINSDPYNIFLHNNASWHIVAGRDSICNPDKDKRKRMDGVVGFFHIVVLLLFLKGF